jgi:hypothetical protein
MCNVFSEIYLNPKGNLHQFFYHNGVVDWNGTWLKSGSPAEKKLADFGTCAPYQNTTPKTPYL